MVIPIIRCGKKPPLPHNQMIKRRIICSTKVIIPLSLFSSSYCLDTTQLLSWLVWRDLGHNCGLPFPSVCCVRVFSRRCGAPNSDRNALFRHSTSCGLGPSLESLRERCSPCGRFPRSNSNCSCQHTM